MTPHSSWCVLRWLCSEGRKDLSISCGWTSHETGVICAFRLTPLRRLNFQVGQKSGHKRLFFQLPARFTSNKIYAREERVSMHSQTHSRLLCSMDRPRVLPTLRLPLRLCLLANKRCWPRVGPALQCHRETHDWCVQVPGFMTCHIAYFPPKFPFLPTLHTPPSSAARSSHTTHLCSDNCTPCPLTPIAA